METMFWYGNAGWAFWQIALMWAFMAAFWGLLVWAAYALITRVTSHLTRISAMIMSVPYRFP